MASIRDLLNNLARDYAIAWSSPDPNEVASFFAADGQLSVNDDHPGQGHTDITAIAAQMRADFPDLEMRCDMMRWANQRAIFAFTLEGHHAETGNLVVTRGWEEWDLTPDNTIRKSHRWFDAADQQRQIIG